jgi:hypothetical protein
MKPFATSGLDHLMHPKASILQMEIPREYAIENSMKRITIPRHRRASAIKNPLANSFRVNPPVSNLIIPIKKTIQMIRIETVICPTDKGSIISPD